MLRAICLLALVAACGSERSPVTAKVSTLGYARPPAIVIIARGQPDLVAPWVASLRASTEARVIGEIAREEGTTDDANENCRDASIAVNGEPFDEVIVLSVLQRNVPLYPCAPGAGCAPPNTKVEIESRITSLRASSCTQVRSTILPTTTGHPPYQHRTADADDATDLASARKSALELLERTASLAKWNIFPRHSSIQMTSATDMVIAGPLALGDYFLKTPSQPTLHPGIQAVSVNKNMTTLRFDSELPKPEPGDELHAVTDMLTTAGFTSVYAGTANAQGKKNGLAGAAIAARWTWDERPVLIETLLAGDLVPGVESQRFFFALAGGLRWPMRYVSPLVLAEVGLGAAYQGGDGARAVGAHVGLGAGLELRLASWFAFADIRVRGFAYGDYTDSEDMPLVVKYPDPWWTTTTAQLGLGFNF